MFTDIEGSTRLWQLHTNAMPAALARHHALLTQAIEAHQGYVFQIIGDAFCAAFHRASDALEAALAAQRLLRDERWGETGPIRVRMALYTGEAEVKEGAYQSGEYQSGLTLSRSARLLSAGHGGQILLAQSTRLLLRDTLPDGVGLEDLGEHPLKDLLQPEHIFQVRASDLPVITTPLKTQDAPKGNLPLALNSFVGRERELAEVQQRLSLARLVTLTGPPGCGKTRLSLECAHSLRDFYPDGAWLVDLSQVSDAGQVVEATAHTFGLVAQGGQSVEEVLLSYLQPRRALLLVDNCEHVLGEAARLCLALLRRCPRLQLLATSQAPLGVPGEHEWLVPSLPLPEKGQAGLAENAAVRLFFERALAVVPDFPLHERNLNNVVEICRRLDGIPLAIELAAARVKLLGVEGIASRLDDRFALLATPRRLVVSRHQTLQAAIDWSFNLLDPQEQLLLTRLSIFSGPFLLEAAEGVCGFDALPGWAVIDLLGELVDHSLVSVIEHPDGPVRYRLLESIRLYGLSRLPIDEVTVLRDRHLEWFTGQARLADQHIHGPQQAGWLDRIEADLPNIRAGLDWAIANPEPARLLTALTLSGAISWFCRVRGYHKDGTYWSEKLLHLAGDEQAAAWLAARAYAYYGLAWLHYIQGEEESHHCIRASRALWIQCGEAGRSGLAYANWHLARLLLEDERDIETSRQLSFESMAVFEETRDLFGVGMVTLLMGYLALYEKDLQTAEALYRKALAILHGQGAVLFYGMTYAFLSELMMHLNRFREMRDFTFQVINHWKSIGFIFGTGMQYLNVCEAEIALGNYADAEVIAWQAAPYIEKTGLPWLLTALDYRLGIIYMLQHRDREAEDHLRKAIATARTTRGPQESLATCLYGLAALYSGVKPYEAVRLAGYAAIQLKKDTSLEEVQPVRLELDQRLAYARRMLGESVYQQALAEGGNLTLDEVLTFEEAAVPAGGSILYQAMPVEPRPAHFSILTASEREVTALIAQGYSNQAIASRMVLDERAVTRLVLSILTKLGYSSRTQIAAWAVEMNLVTTEP